MHYYIKVVLRGEIYLLGHKPK